MLCGHPTGVEAWEKNVNNNARSQDVGKVDILLFSYTLVSRNIFGEFIAIAKLSDK